MEVVTPAAELFSVAVGGSQSNNTIDFGTVYYNAMTHHVRFFEICNHSSQELVFKLTTRLYVGVVIVVCIWNDDIYFCRLDGWAASHVSSEFRFSLSSVAPDFVRHLWLAGGATQRIYVTFYPVASTPDELVDLDDVTE
jgi:hypothetical protein